MSITPCDTCNGENGDLRCTQCKCAFYCSLACQKQDWREHKKICKGLVNECAKFVQKDRNMHEHKQTVNIANGDCPICLESLDSKPLALPCKHVFCQSCLMNHQQYMTVSAACPLCRAQLPDGLFQYVYANAVNFCNMARRYGDKKGHYCSLARKELSAFESRELSSPEIRSLDAQLLYLEEHYDDAVAASLALIDDAEYIKEPLLIEMLRNLISCGLAQHKYRDAMKYIKDLFKICDDPVKYTNDVRFLFHQASICMYELGSFQESVNFGLAAIESNRHYEDVHRSVALSQAALGNYEEAILTMRRAVRYETPWDTGNVARNQAVLDRLLVEAAALVGTGAGSDDASTDAGTGEEVTVGEVSVQEPV